MNRTLRLALPTLLFVVAAPATRAQGLTADSAGARVETPAVNAATATAPEMKAVNTAGPTMNGAAAGVKVARSPVLNPLPEAPRVESRQNKAMMIVGFAGLIAGAVIGGDAGTIIMIGGAGVGLWGLYRYLE